MKEDTFLLLPSPITHVNPVEDCQESNNLEQNSLDGKGLGLPLLSKQLCLEMNSFYASASQGHFFIFFSITNFKTTNFNKITNKSRWLEKTILSHTSSQVCIQMGRKVVRSSGCGICMQELYTG